MAAVPLEQNYWRDGGVSWSRVWAAFGDPRTEVITQTIGRYSLDPVWSYGHYFNTPGLFEQWLVTQDRSLVALQLKVPTDRFVVFDIDLRDMTHEKSAANPLIGRVQRSIFQQRCKHPAAGIQICAGCWPMLQVAIYWLDRRIRRACLGIEAPGLVVFTGNNGVHVWYPLQSDEERLDMALRVIHLDKLQSVPTAADQKVIQTLLPSNWPLDAEATVALVKIDAQPLRPGHLIRCPMSLHTKSGHGSMILGWSHDCRMLEAPYDMKQPVAYSMWILETQWQPPPPSKLRLEPKGADSPLKAVRKKVKAATKTTKKQAHAARLLLPPPQRPYNMRPGIYIPMGMFSTEPGVLDYGTRTMVALETVLRPGALLNYTLIIPILVDRNDIPSAKAKQHPYVAVECRRYFGLLDLDTDFDKCLEIGGTEPLFVDQPESSKGLGKKPHDAKLRFIERMKNESRTFGEMAELCRPFRPLLELVMTLAANPALIVYYSGGAGFRVLFNSPNAWRRILWGDSPAYAERYVQHVLRDEVLMKEPLNVSAEICDVIAGYTDRNIYECNKGVKPDVWAHFETNLWPRRLHAECPRMCLHWRVTGNDNLADVNLSSAIESFWGTILSTAPHIEDCPWLRGDLSE